MKGIVLAGGKGTRLYPLTNVVSKQLLPIFDKPLIYYSMSLLMLSGIRDILIITTPDDAANFRRLLGNGFAWGLSIEYAEQSEPRGLPDAFVIGKQFIGTDAVALVLGDNILYGEGLREMLENAQAQTEGATIFAYYVQNPERYGVVELDANGDAVSIEEKPRKPRSHYAIAGIYFFDNQVVQVAAGLKPSRRGETEIVDVISHYQAHGKLRTEVIGRGMAWLDAGTPESMHEASDYVQVIEKRQGLKIACPEEIAYRLGWIDRDQLVRLAEQAGTGSYGDYLRQLTES